MTTVQNLLEAKSTKKEIYHAVHKPEEGQNRNESLSSSRLLNDRRCKNLNMNFYDPFYWGYNIGD